MRFLATIKKGRSAASKTRQGKEKRKKTSAIPHEGEKREKCVICFEKRKIVNFIGEEERFRLNREGGRRRCRLLEGGGSERKDSTWQEKRGPNAVPTARKEKGRTNHARHSSKKTDTASDPLRGREKGWQGVTLANSREGGRPRISPYQRKGKGFIHNLQHKGGENGIKEYKKQVSRD